MEEKEEKALETFRVLLKEKKFTALRGMAQNMNESDLAVIMEEMEDEDMLKMFRLFPKDLATDVFSQLETDSQQYIITSLSDREAGVIIDNLYSDDAADLLEEMPASVVKRILANARPDTRKDINHLLQYPDDSAGSVMKTDELIQFIKKNPSILKRPIILNERSFQVGYDEEEIGVFVPKELRALASDNCSPDCPNFKACGQVHNGEIKKEA